MIKWIRASLLAFAYSSSAVGARADTLGVSPVRVDVAAPGNSAEVHIENPDPKPMNVQIRLFKWSLVNGADDYQDTEDVVVTPPVAELQSGGSATIRIVRTSSAPVSGEESYRLVIDQLPDANRIVNMGVTISARYTIPVFFVDGDASQPRLRWWVRRGEGGAVLVATNDSDKHARIANLKIGGATIARGLAGYVLGHAERAWPIRSSAARGRVTADTDAGRIDAQVGRKE
jgi:fimbrial chaperone protein